ncbi:CHCH domain-containing protein [Fusarium oxysporum f. sp. phaseoli]
MPSSRPLYWLHRRFLGCEVPPLLTAFTPDLLRSCVAEAVPRHQPHLTGCSYPTLGALTRFATRPDFSTVLKEHEDGNRCTRNQPEDQYGHGIMSTFGSPGPLPTTKPTPCVVLSRPQRGSFPLDHDDKYLGTKRANSDGYFRNLMARDEFKNLGFTESPPPSAVKATLEGDKGTKD